MEHKTKIRFPVFSDYTVHVVVTEDIMEARAELDYLLGPCGGGAASALHSYPADHPVSYLFFNPVLLTYGVVAHETWHCVRAMLEWAGARMENEVVAYHLGYIVDEIHKFLKKKNIPVHVD